MTGRLAVLFGVVALAVAAALPAGLHRSADAGFEVLGHLNPGGAYTADIWGHRGFAYLSSYRDRDSCPAAGVRVIDVRNPRRPRLVSRFGSVAGTWTEKTIVRRVTTPGFRGDLAVTSMQSCKVRGWHGFGVYDVTNPRRPRQLALVRTEPRGSHEIWLGTAGRRAYVYTAIIRSEVLSAPDYSPDRDSATRPGEPDFRIYDVSAPGTPRRVGGWGAWKSLDIHPNAGIGQGRGGGNFVHSVITNDAGTRAYLSYWDLGTVILDISNPAAPHYLGRTGFEGDEDGNAHSAAVNADGTLLIETHETGGGTARLWDISDPSAPKRLGEVKLSDQLLRQGRRGEEVERVQGLDLSDSVHDPKLSGRFAFFSWYRQGFVAADVSNPAEPVVVARHLPTPTRDRDQVFCPGRSCRAAWGVYATPQYVLASDLIGGLWILRFRAS